MRHRPLTCATLAAAALVLTLAASAAQPAKPQRPALPLKEFMAHIMQRNAEQLWAWTAESEDATGPHSGQPTSEAAWENAESDALTLTELTYTLQSPTYRLPAPGWTRHLAQARAAAQASAKAAQAHDYPALQKAADDLNSACVACHLRFAPDLEKAPPPPNF
jgi:hypothetical protein